MSGAIRRLIQILEIKYFNEDPSHSNRAGRNGIKHQRRAIGYVVIIGSIQNDKR